jgi:hypothetical protein
MDLDVFEIRVGWIDQGVEIAGYHHVIQDHATVDCLFTIISNVQVGQV